MKRYALIGLVLTALATSLTGCDWGTGDEANSWSSSYDWVNFSGTYRSAFGGLLVTDYTTTPTIPGETNTVKVVGEVVRAYGYNDSDFGGIVAHENVVPGTLSITLSSNNRGFRFDESGVFKGSGSGSVDFANGSWEIDSPGSVTDGGNIIASYQYFVANSGTAGGNAVSGATRIKIFLFSLTQQGQNITIVDNNGSTYSGKISQIKSSSGAQNTDIPQVASDETAHHAKTAKATYYESELPANGDAIIANFTASGISAANMSVTIVGTLEGVVGAGIFTGRIMNGTWVELGGKTGNINATAAAVLLPNATGEAPPAE